MARWKAPGRVLLLNAILFHDIWRLSLNHLSQPTRADQAGVAGNERGRGVHGGRVPVRVRLRARVRARVCGVCMSDGCLI